MPSILLCGRGLRYLSELESQCEDCVSRLVPQEQLAGFATTSSFPSCNDLDHPSILQVSVWQAGRFRQDRPFASQAIESQNDCVMRSAM